MTTSLTELQPGAVISGRYELIEEIGRGGFGVVYRAMQKGVNRSVALKTLRANVAQIPGYDFAEAFRQEARHTSQLRHPNSITLFDYGETDDGMLWFVTEFLDGETLYERMWREQVVSVKFASHVAVQIAKSLAEAHNLGIIHGDLKPANIFLIDLYGEKDFVKVLDFGIAKIIGEVDPAGMGTPEYMSPEQFSGQPLLAASDIYSLGVIMYEMVMGHRPFDDEDTGKLARKQLLEPLPPMSPEVEQSPLGYVIRRATAKEPANRYADGLALVEALTSIGKKSTPEIAAKKRAPADLHSPAGREVASATSAPELEVREGPPSSDALESRAIADSWVRSARPPLFGREQDRAWLLDQVSEVVEGTGKIVLLGGAAGVGKTRLAQWLVREAELPGGAVAGSGEYREGSPLVMEGVADSFAEALGLPMQASEGHSRSRLEETLTNQLGRPLTQREIDAVHGLYVQGFAAGLQIDTDSIAELLITYSNSRPLVLHLDNVQSVGDNTLALLEAVAKRMDDAAARLFMLLTVRREALPAVQDIANRLLRLVGKHSSVTPRSLVALTEEEATELTASALKAEAEARAMQGDVAETAVSAIVTRSHGNPLYVLQLVCHLTDEKLLSASEGIIGLKESANVDGMIPPKIGGLLRLRVAQLTHRHEKGKSLEFLLLRCALLGDNVPREVLVEFLGLEASSGEGLAGVVLTELRELVPIVTMEDLLVQQSRTRADGTKEATLKFTQPLIYQILSERVSKLPDVGKLHSLAGRAKQKFHEEMGELSLAAEEIGDHFMLSGGTQETIGFYIHAARTMGAQGQEAAASQMLERALETMGDDERFAQTALRVRVARAELAASHGHLDEFRRYKADAQEAADLLGSSQASAELVLIDALRSELAAEVASEARFLEAEALFEDLATSTGTLPPDLRGADLTGHLLTMAPLSPSLGVAICKLGRARILVRECRLREADALLTDAKRLFENLESDWGTGQTMVSLGRMYLSLGYLQRAESILDRAAELLAPSGGFGYLQARLAVAEVLRVRGSLALAEAAIQQGLVDCGPDRGLRARAAGSMHLASVVGLQGAGDTQDMFDIAVDLYEKGGDRAGLFLALLTQGIFHARQGRYEEAENYLDRALTLAEEGRFNIHVTRMQLLQGTIAAGRNDLKGAKNWYAQCIELCMLLGDRISLAEAHALMARLVRHKRSPVALPIALSHLDTARNCAAELGATMHEVLLASEAVAVAWTRTGATDKALPLLQEALQGWQHIGNVTEVERVEALVAKVSAA